MWFNYCRGGEVECCTSVYIYIRSINNSSLPHWSAMDTRVVPVVVGRMEDCSFRMDCWYTRGMTFSVSERIADVQGDWKCYQNWEIHDHNQTNKWLKRRLLKYYLAICWMDVMKNILVICWMWCRKLSNKVFESYDIVKHCNIFSNYIFYNLKSFML